jgi:hypothetical protein
MGDLTLEILSDKLASRKVLDFQTAWPGLYPKALATYAALRVVRSGSGHRSGPVADLATPFS